MAIFQPDTNLMTQLQGYRSQRGLTSGQRLSTPEWRGIVEGYNSSQYRNALEMAKIAEQRRQQAMALQTQKDMMDQRMAGSELKGAGQLTGGLYSGYKMGQDIGLWGNKGATTATNPFTQTPVRPTTDPGTIMNPNPNYGALNVNKIGGTIGQQTGVIEPVESTPGLASLSSSGTTPLSGLAESTAAGTYTAPIGIGLEGTAPLGVGSLGYAPLEGVLGGVGADSLIGAGSTLAGEGVGAGIGAGMSAAAEGTAAGASAAAPAAAGMSVAGPIGMGVGGAMLLASLLGFGPEEWF
jgi:hypothetical protein